LARRTKIVGIADASLGYGSPELPALMHSLCLHFDADGILIEPDELSRPPVAKHPELKFELTRIKSDYEDHTPLWHAQYLDGAYDLLAKHEPDIVVLWGGVILGGMHRLKKQPKLLIYHACELISSLSERVIDAHKVILDRVDLIITPEIERFIVDMNCVGVYPQNVTCIYNVADVDFPRPPAHKPYSERNGRFIWYGTLHRRAAFANYFYDPMVREFEFDIYGRITDPEAELVEAAIRGASNIRYYGLAASQDLNRQRQNNIFSLVWWNPELSAGHYYLSPNRFFTSLQAGLPIICGPHPQCEDLINRYGCGLVMPDWSLPAFKRTLGEAMEIYRSSDYKIFVDNCQIASADALNWEAQFERIMTKLAPIIESKPDAKNLLRR